MRFKLVPAMVAFGLVVAIAVAALFVWRAYPWLFSADYVLKVATGPLTSDAGKFVTAFKREMTQEHPRIRVSIVETASIGASALALKNREVDLAVGRSDDPNVADDRSVFILRKIYAVFLVAPHASVDSIGDLSGERIGVLTAGTDLDPLAKAVLDFYRFEDKHTSSA